MAPLLSSTPPTATTGAGGLGALAMLLLISGAALVMVWALLRMRDAIARRKNLHDPSRRPPSLSEWLVSLGASRRSATTNPGTLENVARDVEELTERLASRMDEQAERLERLIAIADDRLARLEHALGADEPAPRIHVRETRAPEPGPRSMRAALGRMVEDQRTDEHEPARSVVAPPAPRARVEEPDPINRRVCELADMGKDPAEIAAALDEHIGKVQLILALRDA